MISSMYPPDHEGGAELSAQAFTDGLRARGYDVQVLTRRWRPVFQGVREEHPHVHRILEGARLFQTMPNWLAQKWDTVMAYKRATTIAIPNLPRVREFLEGREFDVVFVFESQGLGLLVVEPLVERGVPILWQISSHALKKVLAPPRLLQLSQNLTCPALWRREHALPYDHMVFVSQFMKDHYARHGIRPRHSYVLRRGIEFEPPAQVCAERTDPPNFVLVGRIARVKGVHVVIEAAGLLAKMRPGPWTLDVYGGVSPGDELYADRVQRRARELGIGDRVVFHGQRPRPEVLERIRGAAGMIISSIYEEPFARTVIEGLGTGAPLIITRSGAFAEIFEGTTCGLLYERENPEELARHMAKLLDDPEEGRRMAQDGLDLARTKYRLDPLLDEAEKILHHVVQNHRLERQKPSSPELESVIVK
jgi:glycosyltransferase involved in cell wall biosynthesis